MKAIKEITISFFILLLSYFVVLSQPQWKFHIAFEDATGAKDTLWMLYDTTATLSGVDTALGEGYIPLDHSKFNVWIYNPSGDTTKTNAFPFYTFTSHLLYNIRAINYTFPIYIHWDTALFNSPILPIQTNNFINVARIDNDYFFNINNDLSLHAFNMLLDDSAYAPYFNFGTHDQFPMTISFSYEPVGIEIITSIHVNFFPNPVIDNFSIQSINNISSIQIYDLYGVIVRSISHLQNKEANVDISNLNPGFYFIVICDESSILIKTPFIKL